MTIETDDTDDAASGDIEIWPENWPALLIFLDLATQWRAIAGLGGIVWLGLSYDAVELMCRRHGVDVFRDVMVLEQAALPVLNERRE